MHTYPIWERKDIDEALSYTIETIDDVRAALPGKRIVIGEAGWASYTIGNQHVARAGDEEKQRRHFKELMAWSRKEAIPVFWFSAFDEPWKGTGTEGYWGLFDVNRNPKLAMHEWYPERVVATPTSPQYSEDDNLVGPSIGVAFADGFTPLIGEGGVNIAAGWDDVVTVAESDVALAGGRSLTMTHNGKDWGGFFFYLDSPFDTSPYSRLVVSIKLPPQIAELEIKLESPGGHGQGASLGQFERTDLSDDWAEYSIPLSAYRTPDLSQLTILGFWHPKDSRGKLVAGQVFIDNIRFE